mgnify:CR=1 FL=1
MDPFDPENLRMDSTSRPRVKPSKRVPRHKPGQWFIKGPLPGEWIRRAIGRPAGARAALVLWYLAGLTKSSTVTPTHADWARFGVGRLVGHRGIVLLGQAGLVRVDRHRGRCPVVTILDVSE